MSKRADTPGTPETPREGEPAADADAPPGSDVSAQAGAEAAPGDTGDNDASRERVESVAGAAGEAGETGEAGEGDEAAPEPDRIGPGRIAGATPAPSPKDTPPEATADAPPPAESSTADTEPPAPAAAAAQVLVPPDAAQAAEPRRRRRRRVLKGLAIGTSLLLVATAGAAYVLYRKLNGNIRTDEATAHILKEYESERPKKAAVTYDAQNILLIGSDDRSGDNAKYGGEAGTQRSDTTILLHLAADRKSATAVSIPRDLMVDIPACRQEDGTETAPQRAQFNWAFQFGGAACTIRTVETMTDIRVDHHLIVDFTGFKKMVDAVDGVDICLPEAVKDREAHLDLPAGPQTVYGEDALAYVRARYSLGDGSDTERMARQQQFLASLVKKVKSNGVLFSPTKLYSLMDAATSSLVADEGLDSLRELYNLARSLQKTPTGNVVFMTAPREPYALDPNRDQLVQPAADEVFAALREDRRVDVEGLGAVTADGEPATSSGSGEEPADSGTGGSPSAPASPPSGEESGRGGTADDGTQAMSDGTAARLPAGASSASQTPSSSTATSSSSSPSSPGAPYDDRADPNASAKADICGTS